MNCPLLTNTHRISFRFVASHNIYLLFILLKLLRKESLQFAISKVFLLKDRVLGVVLLLSSCILFQHSHRPNPNSLGNSPFITAHSTKLTAYSQLEEFTNGGELTFFLEWNISSCACSNIFYRIPSLLLTSTFRWSSFPSTDLDSDLSLGSCFPTFSYIFWASIVYFTVNLSLDHHYWGLSKPNNSSVSEITFCRTISFKGVWS